MDTVEFIVVIGACLILALLGVGFVIAVVMDVIEDHRARRREHVEVELDRTAEQLRVAVFELANQLGADAHEARKALIRESFLASGRVPPAE